MPSLLDIGYWLDAASDQLPDTVHHSRPVIISLYRHLKPVSLLGSLV